MTRKILKLCQGLAVLCLGFGLVNLVHAAAQARPDLWQPNGPVHATAIDDDIAHLFDANGAFRYDATTTTGGTIINSITNVPDATFPQINGPVYAVLPTGSLSWYIGGDFTQVGGQSRNNLAYITWDVSGGVWQVDAWDPDLNGAVWSIVMADDGQSLFVGGEFTTLQGGMDERSFLANITINGPATVTSWDPDADAPIRDMVISKTKDPVTANDIVSLYVGGFFTTFSGGTIKRNHLARLNLDTLPDVVVDEWDPDVDDMVYTIALSGNAQTVYAGGAFSTINTNLTRPYAAAFSATNGSAVINWDPVPAGVVRDIVILSGQVILAGDFTSVKSASQKYLAMVNTTDGSAEVTWAPKVDDVVHAMLYSPLTGELIIGGDFTSVNGFVRNRLAALNLTGATLGTLAINVWDTVHVLSGYDDSLFVSGGLDKENRRRLFLGGEFDYVGPMTGAGVFITANGMLDNGNVMPQVTGTINAVLPDGNNGWYIGGDFTHVGGQSRNNLAYITWDASSGVWQVDAWDPDLNGAVWSIVMADDGQSLFVGGEFTTLQGGAHERSFLANITINGPATVTSWDPDADAPVRDMVLSKTQDPANVTKDVVSLYVGGFFTTFSGGTIKHNHLARLNLDALPTVVVDVWDAKIDAPVRALAVDATQLYIGGDFTDYAVAVNKADGVMVWSANADAPVRALALAGGRLYLGGDFTVPGNHIAAMATTDGELVSAWSANASVHALAPSKDGSALYIGGDFTLFGGLTRTRLAAVSVSTGAVLNWQPMAGGSVHAIADNGQIFVGGQFTSVGGVKRQNLAALDFTSGQVKSWAPDSNGPVYAMQLTPGGLYIGGAFSEAGGQTRSNIAQLDINTGLATSWSIDVNSTVYSLAASRGGIILFIGGAFSQVEGEARNGLAVIDKSGFLLSTWNPLLEIGSVVHAMVLLHNEFDLYIGGNFKALDANQDVIAENIAVVNRSTGAFRQWYPNANATVRVLHASADEKVLYVGGDFTLIDKVFRDHLAALDPLADESSKSYVTDWRASGAGQINNITSVAISRDRTTLYIGGDFSEIDMMPRGNLVALRAYNGSVIDDGSWQPEVNDAVTSFRMTDDQLLVTGHFTAHNDAPHSSVLGLSLLASETDAPNTKANPSSNSYNQDTRVNIVLSCDDDVGSGCSATFYSLDDGGWRLYRSPLSLEKTVKLRFFSVDNAGNSEDPNKNVENYTYELTKPVTVITPSSRVYEQDSLLISLSCSDDDSGCDATYYTLDDSRPTIQSTRYSGPFTIRGNAVVKYFSIDKAGNAESVRRASFINSDGGSGNISLMLLVSLAWLMLIRCCKCSVLRGVA